MTRKFVTEDFFPEIKNAIDTINDIFKNSKLDISDFDGSFGNFKILNYKNLIVSLLEHIIDIYIPNSLDYKLEIDLNEKSINVNLIYNPDVDGVLFVNEIEDLINSKEYSININIIY